MKFDFFSEKVISQTPVSGGDINEALCITLESGAKYFVKHNASLGREVFEAESIGLEALSNCPRLHIPKVIECGEESGEGFLVLEWIESGSGSSNSWGSLGQSLAHLHKYEGETRYGFETDNWIGRLPQKNTWNESWKEFWCEQRLVYQLEMAEIIPSELRARIRKLMESPFFYEHPGLKPSLLHGDLWSGNVLMSKEGTPYLIDPAVYWGDREVELAFTELFGGFHPSFYEGYSGVYPLDPGYEARKPLWQLYPLLVHVNLFGSGYLGSLESKVMAAESQFSTL